MAGRLNTAMLADGLRSLGLRAGDNVLVHSALSALGWVDGGADSVVEALRLVTGPDGTVLFPTLTGAPTDAPDTPPHCHVGRDTTWCGQIPCAALRHPHHIRSLHPSHSVTAIGNHAEALTKGHQHALSPCGAGSPYTKLAERGGRLLLIGVGHDSNTTFHTAEELAGAPYVSYPGKHDASVVDPAGNSIVVPTPIHRWDRPRRFEYWNEALVQAGIVQEGTIGNAPCRLMESSALIEWLVQLLQRNPRALLAEGTPYA